MQYNVAMRPLKWSTSHAVFVTEIDDDHREIFEAVSNVEKLLGTRGPSPETEKALESLISSITGHFAHEERLMHAARYDAMAWHKQQHNAARKRVGEFIRRIEGGETKAGVELVEYLTSWLHNHTRLEDRMLGAFLRNEQRSLCRVVFQTSTKPADGCTWVDAEGDKFDPRFSDKGY
jgi:hemerythrin-like metal-binding protein